MAVPPPEVRSSAPPTPATHGSGGTDGRVAASGAPRPVSGEAKPRSWPRCCKSAPSRLPSTGRACAGDRISCCVEQSGDEGEAARRWWGG